MSTPQHRPDWTTHFLQVYSEDVAFLHKARNALATHPMMRGDLETIDVSIGRLHLILAIGAVDAVMRSQEQTPFARAYLNEGPADQRLEEMRAEFAQVNVPVDQDTIQDFLAIKYLRNSLVHSSPRSDAQMTFIEQRSFPVDLTEFGEAEWRRVSTVITRFIGYVVTVMEHRWISSHGEEEVFPGVDDLVMSYQADPNLVRWLVEPRHVGDIWWLNLDKLHHWLENPQFVENWKADPGPVSLGETALDAWRCFWDAKLASLGIRDQDVASARETLQRLHEEDAYLVAQAGDISVRSMAGHPDDYEALAEASDDPERRRRLMQLVSVLRRYTTESLPHRAFWDSGVPEDLSCAATEVFLGGRARGPIPDIARALRLGNQAHNHWPGMAGTVRLFLEQLPAIEPARSPEYLAEGSRALEAWKLADAWYAYVESGELPSYDRWEKFDQARAELSHQAQPQREQTR